MNKYCLKGLKFALLLLSSISLAAEDVPASNVREDVLTSQAIMQVLFGLALVIVIILILAWVLRRVSNLQQSHQKMKIVSSLSLGTREKAVLIEVGDRQVLLGVSPGSVSLLESFSERVITASPDSEFDKKLKQSLDAGSSE
ncbi:flagellar biosynthetic protein FliO [Neptunomonas japonica]|uniref:Flagellar protein n=1 Tax=Neptunomonas japonica JAMM 1380 TaxID=1441457 RepID=A0A7R6PLJ6_9GAMM|nr:flagellar biosynthetic protein FliO [Neptunomonas japonica]BBB28677.1 flagellar protein FliO/FliZ [Neptunomonas japonica JAMM 1380]